MKLWISNEKSRFQESNNRKAFEDGENKKRAWGKTFSPFKLIEET